jgi:hypothetical protein
MQLQAIKATKFALFRTIIVAMPWQLRPRIIAPVLLSLCKSKNSPSYSMQHFVSASVASGNVLTATFSCVLRHAKSIGVQEPCQRKSNPNLKRR